MEKESCNYILDANLFDLLVYAIKHLKEAEAKVSPTFCSGFRAGLESNLEAMKKGELMYVR